MSTYQLNVLVSLVLAAALLVPESQSTVLKRYCGQHLSNALRLECGGVYNQMFKKNDREMAMDYPMGPPFQPREKAYMIMRLRRKSRGIHDECCLKPCSRDELRTYCGSH